MRFFKNVFATTAIVAMGIIGVFAQSENVVVSGIQSVTTASATLQVSVFELSMNNFASKGSEIVSGLKNLTVSITTFTQAITFTKPMPLDNSVAEEVVEVLTGLVNVHQALLNTIIGKQSIASKFILTAPIAAALHAIEKVVNLILPGTKSNVHRIRCSGMTHCNTRCKRQVNLKKDILYPCSTTLPFYCHNHLSAGLKPLMFRCLKHRDKTVAYDEYIPLDLECHTQVLLREQMCMLPCNSDKAGYIYSLRIEDTANPDLVHIKVGRTNTMNRHMAEHLHNCPSGHLIVLGYYPRRSGATQAKLSLAIIKPSQKVPFAAMIEDLVHLELSDVAANTLPSGAIIPGVCLGVKKQMLPCIDCGHVHKEIFTFCCLSGDQHRLEWELLVLPVIEAWGAYIAKFV